MAVPVVLTAMARTGWRHLFHCLAICDQPGHASVQKNSFLMTGWRARWLTAGTIPALLAAVRPAGGTAARAAPSGCRPRRVPVRLPPARAARRGQLADRL